MEFKVKISEYGECVGCDCCGSEDNTPTAVFDCGSPNSGKKMRLCEICARTNICSEFEVGRHRDTWLVLRVIAQVGNILLAEIRKSKEPPHD